MADKISVALITNAGGAHVGAYLTALAEAGSCGEVILVDPDGRWENDARQALRDKLTQVTGDHKALLRTNPPGMALVTLEAALAPPVIDAALEAGCHVFAEKPSCVRAEDFAPLVVKADSKHRHLMLALANRSNPETIVARDLIQTGAIGKLYGLELHIIADQTRLTRSGYAQQWFAQKSRAGGGHLVWLGIHWIDLAMMITGESITRVAGFVANIGGQPLDVEDSATAAIQFSGGALGTVTSGYYLDKGYHSHIKIWGSNGWMHIDAMADKPLQWYSTKGANAGQVQQWEGEREPRGYTPFVSEAIKCCAEMSDPPISSHDSYRVLKTVHAIYQSAESGRAVALDVS